MVTNIEENGASEKNILFVTARTNQTPYKSQIREIAPYVRTYALVIIWYKYHELVCHLS